MGGLDVSVFLLLVIFFWLGGTWSLFKCYAVIERRPFGLCRIVQVADGAGASSVPFCFPLVFVSLH